MLAIGFWIGGGGGPAFAQRPLGTDVSGYQPVVSWMFAKNHGVAFGWAKATEGTGYVNPEYVEQITGARAVGIHIGSYHFARPSSHPNLTGANSAESEAQFFWSVASNYIKAGGQYMMPMLDWEDVNMSNQLSAATCSAWVNQWCNSVSNYAFANGVSGVRPVVYTGAWYSTPSSAHSGLTTAVTGWPAWIAAYPSNPNPQTGGPSSTYPWPTWTFWQYADTNWTGGDADVFKGTLAGLGAHIVGGLGAPYFASQPSSRHANQAGSITFRSLANGAAPLSYQWRLNGANLPNATSPSLTLVNLTSQDAGNYTVVVTNSFGSITSSVATLTVNGFFTPVFADDFDADSSGNWTLNRSSTDSRVAFAFNYASLGIPAAPHSIGGTTKGLKLEANVSAGAVGAVNLSPRNQIFSGDYRLHYDLWLNQNGPFPAGGTGSTQHHTAGIGTAGNRVQWNSGTADGVWFATDGEGQATDTSASLPDWRVYVGTALQTAGSGVYAGGTEANIRGNGHPYYQNVFPGGQTAPAAQAQTGGLEVGTIGFAWRDVIINKTGNVIEWFIDGLKIARVTNAIPAGNVFVGYWDSFASLSSNTNLSFSLVDNVRVEIPALPPVIISQPLATAVKITSNATFTVTATGTPAPTYQWRFNGTNIPGATAATFTRTNVQYAQAGNYSVAVGNLAGSVTSADARLTILPAAPATFELVTLQSDGSLTLRLQGDAGATYFVETSTNLVDWSALTNVSLSGPTVLFSVGPATSEPQRYFRARSAP